MNDFFVYIINKKQKKLSIINKSTKDFQDMVNLRKLMFLSQVWI